jgi:stage II sporulation protein D
MTAAERKLPGEPNIRVRIQRGIGEVTLTSPTKIQIYALDDPASKQLLSTPQSLRLSAGQWLTASTQPLSRNSILVIDPLGPAPIGVDGRRYPGAIRLVPETRDQKNINPAHDRFDVVNHVRIEAYLPGVLDRELYDHWQPAAYLSQAIAARSYAISRIIDFGPGRHFDVENNQTSQAYAGLTTTAICNRAVADTMGLVLTWNRQVIPAYYSSTCGGVGASDADAFGSASPLPPLRPARTHSYCASSRYFDWGPFRQKRDALAKRIAAWGRSRGYSLAELEGIVYLRVSAANHLGRSVEFEITDKRGKSYRLRGESFRNACNYSSDALKIDPPDNRLYSSFVQVAIDGDDVVFSDGHGFGHGVGLCQFGAEGMARAGFTPMQILAEYYPGASVDRAY